MRRCHETREIIAPGLPYEERAELREVDFGAWEGKTLDWLESHDADNVAIRRCDPANFSPPGGESFAEVATRLRPLVESLDPTDTLLIVSHRGTLGVLERLLRNVPIDSQGIVALQPGEFRVLPL